MRDLRVWGSVPAAAGVPAESDTAVSAAAADCLSTGSRHSSSSLNES